MTPFRQFMEEVIVYIETTPPQDTDSLCILKLREAYEFFKEDADEHS